MSTAAQAERSGLEIAIIGMAGRFPGAADVEAFWRNLCEGVESIATLTHEELLAAGVAAHTLAQPNYVRAGALLDDIELFDAELFGFTPREAATLDPQHRQFLEAAWLAFEHAGYDPQRLSVPVGVYAGSGMNGYQSRLFPEAPKLESAADMAAMLALDKDFLATRVSYKLDLRGPSLAVQTACSTSLVAVHLACQGLLNGECDMALAGGVSISVPQRVGYLYQEGGIASPDGHCRPFDAAARGTVAGSGVGVVLLKRLDDAIADGDAIVAVIKGSAINNDGHGKVGFTAPSVQGQARVIRDAQRVAGVEPSSIGYVEAHGTATPFGDPIEVAALSEAFRGHGAEPGFCALGSLKSNVGHLDAAAGVAGLIKAALVVERGWVPASLHFEQANPAIDLERGPFRVATQLAEFPRGLSPRRAGVSSFGLGGTNAHVVLEQPPAGVRAVAQERPQLLLLSARSQASLRIASEALAQRIEAEPSLSLADVAHTLREGRRPFPYRRALVCRDHAQACAALREACYSTPVAQARPVAFLFPGQGAQHPGMGRELYASDASFRADLDRAAEYLLPRLGADLRHDLFPEPARLVEARTRLANTAITQPALFAFEHALAQWWMRQGVVPEALLGHSVGEYVAACLADCISLEDALELVLARGRLMERTQEGAMLAVFADEAEVSGYLREGLSLAAVNSDHQCVLSGTLAAVAGCEDALRARGVASARLPTTRAFHSLLMDPVLAEFREVAAGVGFRAPRLPWLSNVTGTWITEAQACDPEYWVRHLREPVRFAACITTLRERAERVLLEVGPAQTLTRLCRQGVQRSGAAGLDAEGPLALTSLPDDVGQARQPCELQQLLASRGQLWAAGVSIDWATLHADGQGRRVHLPGTPLERQRHWLERPHERVKSGAARALPECEDAAGPWCYAPSFRRAPNLGEPATTLAREHWLVFADGKTLEVARALERAGARVTLAQLAGAFARLGDGQFTVRSDHPEDYQALARALAATPVTCVVYAWGCGQYALDALEVAALQTSMSNVLYPLLHAVQAFCDGPARLLVLTTGAADVTGAESILPGSCAVLGLCRSIALEYPQTKCRVVDVEACSLEQAAVDGMVRKLIGELQVAEGCLTALRGPYRWVEALEALELAGEGPSSLRPQGVYVITGGRGAVGLELAELLAHAVKARLLLVGRTPVTPEQRDRIRRLEAAGAEVVCAEIDASEPNAMHRVLASAVQRFGAIHGVIHAAGVAEGGLLATLSAASTAEEMRAKASGALVLLQALRSVDAYQGLDFVLLCSSLTSLSGGVGQAAYAAANACLDGIAHAALRQGGPYVASISFDRFCGLGMAARAEARLRDLGSAALLREGLSAQQGQHVVKLLLSQRVVPHVAVSSCRLEGMPRDEEGLALAREVGLGHYAVAGAQAQGAATPSVVLDPSLPLPAQMAALWADAFGVTSVDPHKNFFELGGESLLALQILNRIRAAFAVEIHLREFFEHATVHGLAACVQRARGLAAPQPEPALVALPRTARRVVRTSGSAPTGSSHGPNAEGDE